MGVDQSRAVIMCCDSSTYCHSPFREEWTTAGNSPPARKTMEVVQHLESKFQAPRGFGSSGIRAPRGVRRISLRAYIKRLHHIMTGLFVLTRHHKVHHVYDSSSLPHWLAGEC